MPAHRLRDFFGGLVPTSINSSVGKAERMIWTTASNGSGVVAVHLPGGAKAFATHKGDFSGGLNQPRKADLPSNSMVAGGCNHHQATRSRRALTMVQYGKQADTKQPVDGR